MITSTPGPSSVRARLTAASNISAMAGDGVWCTTSSVGIGAQRTSPGRDPGARQLTWALPESDKVGQPGGRHPAGSLLNLAVRLHLQGREAVAAGGNGPPKTGGGGATGRPAGRHPAPPAAHPAPPTRPLLAP